MTAPEPQSAVPVEPLTAEQIEEVRGMLSVSAAGYHDPNVILLLGAARKLLATLDAAILAALPVPDAPTAREELDEAWAALRNGLSKAYVARDIDDAIATARPRIEAAATLRATPTGIDPERLGTAMDDSEVWRRFALLVIEYDRLSREASHRDTRLHEGPDTETRHLREQEARR